MPNYVKLAISGHLGRAPESAAKKTRAGKTVCEFSVAFNTHKKGDSRNKVVWFDCVAFGATAEQILGMQFIKGQAIYITNATPRPEYWKDKGTGHERMKIRWIVWDASDTDPREQESGKDPWEDEPRQGYEEPTFNPEEEFPY